MRRLGVTFNFRHPLANSPLPENITGLLGEAKKLPCVHGVVLDRGNCTVKSHLKTGVRIATDRRDDKHAIAYDDGRSMAEAGDRCPPANIGTRFDIPSYRQSLAV